MSAGGAEFGSVAGGGGGWIAGSWPCGAWVGAGAGVGTGLDGGGWRAGRGAGRSGRGCEGSAGAIAGAWAMTFCST